MALKLELEFNPPTPADEAMFHMFMREKSIKSVTLEATDGTKFSIATKRSQTEVRAGSGPLIPVGGKLS